MESTSFGGNPLACKRCLVYEMADAAKYKNMYDYINNLEEDIKTPKEEYDKRLAICKECEKLLSGVCRACGCFVEMRAAVKTRRCPDVDSKW